MTRLSPLARTSTVAALSFAVVAAAANAGPNRAVEPGTPPRHQLGSVRRDVGTVPPIQVVSTAWLAEHINDPDLVVLQIERSAMHREPTIPGARVLPYSTMSVAREGLTTELPSPDSLVRLFEGVGISDSTLVVVTSSFEAPMASRALMSLDYLGHQRLAFLDGGVMQWRLEERAMSQAAPNVTRGRITARVREDLIVDASWITGRIAGGAIALIDTRTDGEYVGAGERNGMPSDGHLDGASQLEWQQLFVRPESMVLRDTASLRRLYAERMRAGDTLVTYCWIGYRASMTYVAARTLGLPVRFYDGSYQDWQQRRLPVTAGSSRRKAAGNPA